MGTLDHLRVSSTYINSHALVDEYRRRGIFDEQMRVDVEGCLDAPDILPAGSVIPKAFGSDADEFVEVLSTASRGQ